MDYPELIAEVSERSGLPGLPSRAEQLTRMAEADLNKRLFVGNQEDTRTLTTDADGLAPLPLDYFQMRRVDYGGKELRQFGLKDIQTGAGYGYAIRGGNMVTSIVEKPLTITYYRGLPALSLAYDDWVQNDWDADDWATEISTNWLLESDSEIYVYALLKQWLAFKMDERAATADQYLDRLVSDRNMQDRRARFNGVRFRTAGPTP